MQLLSERRPLVLCLAGCAVSVALQTVGLASAQLGLRAPTSNLLLAVILVTGFFGALEGSWLAGTAAAAGVGLLQIGISYLMAWSADAALFRTMTSSSLAGIVASAFFLAYLSLGALGAIAARYLGRHPTQHKVTVLSVLWLVGFGLLRWIWVRFRLGSFLELRPPEPTLFQDVPTYAWWLLPPLALLVWRSRMGPAAIDPPAAG